MLIVSMEEFIYSMQAAWTEVGSGCSAFSFLYF